MSANRFPKLHNAAWPGVVGKGPDSEPPIDLDTMLDLTANAEVDGQKFDGVDLFLYDPHIDIDISDDALKAWADKFSDRNLAIGSVVAPIWGPTGGGAAIDPGAGRAAFLEAVRKGCRIARKLKEWGARPYGVVRIDTASGVADWAADPAGNTANAIETFKQAAAIASDHGEKLAAEGEICWGGMHSWRYMLEILEGVDSPDVGFQADMAHTLLYTLGYNAPEHALLPQDFAWDDEDKLDNALRTLTAALRPWTIDFHVAAERCDGTRHGQPRPHRAPLSGGRPAGQAGYRQARGVLAARRERRIDEKDAPYLLGRLHVPQRGDDAAADLERHSGGDGLGARRPRLERLAPGGGFSVPLRPGHAQSGSVGFSRVQSGSV